MKINWTHLGTLIFLILLNIFVLVLLFGCSDARIAQRHLIKAQKHGYICADSIKTITLTDIDSIPYIVAGDTVWKYIITKRDTIIQVRTQFVPKTRFEIRYIYKTIKQQVKADVQKQKIVAKMERKSFPWWLIPLVIGLIIFILYLQKLTNYKQ